jgi:hypothetical protein
MPRTGVDAASFRTASAASLLIPGSILPLRELLADRAGGQSLAHSVPRVLRDVARRECGDAILRALTQLSDRLRAEGSPIDYERRRCIAAAASFLEAAEWERIRIDAGIPPGGAQQFRYARLRIYEALTGGLITMAPAALAPSRVCSVDRYYRFCQRLSPQAAESIDTHARDILARSGVTDEPLTWSPPREWVSQQGLPGPDPDGLDPEEVGLLLRAGHSVRAVAATLHTTLEHIRFVIRRHPPYVRPPERPRPVVAAQAKLSPEELQRLIVGQRRSMVSVAVEYGIPRKTLRRLTRLYHIKCPAAPRRPRYQIDPGWLQEQYVRRGRTLAQIATELEIAPSTVAKFARRYGIPPRVGARAHVANLGVSEGMPEPLASAVRGEDGTQRVRRFQVYARIRSLPQTAKLLGANESVLRVQLAKLEHACDGILLRRVSRAQRPLELTALGHLLLRQADRHFGPHPAAPRDLPEPLRSVAATFWSRKRLRWFQVVARSKTLKEAASALCLEPHNLNRSLRKLEVAAAGTLLERDGVRRPHQLSPLGRRLLRQADRYLERRRIGT